MVTSEGSVEVVAEEEIEAIIEDDLVDAGITPDSSLYAIDMALDDLSLALTFDEEAKVEKSLEIAEERLSETQEMVEEGNTEAADEAQAGYEEAVTGAEESVEELETDGTVEDSEDALGTVSELQDKIEGHAAKVAAVKDAILLRKAGTMSEEQLAHLTTVFARIKAKALEMETKTTQKKEKAKIKYKALSGKTDEEVDAVMEEIEEKAGLAKSRMERVEKEAKRIAKVTKKVKEDAKNSKMSAKLKGEVADLEARAAKSAKAVKEVKALKEKAAKIRTAKETVRAKVTSDTAVDTSLETDSESSDSSEGNLAGKETRTKASNGKSKK